MKYLRLPMHVSIPVVLLLSTAVWAAYTLHHDSRVKIQEVEKTAQEHLIQEMTDLQRELEHLIRRGDIGGVQLEIGPMGADPDLHYVFLSDERDIVLFATERNWVGQDASEIFTGIQKNILADVRRTLTGNIYFSADHERLLGYYPVVLGTQKNELRPSKVGILFMLYDLSNLKVAALRSVQSQVLQSSLFLLGLSGLLALFFHFSLTRRVARIVAATERLAAGDLNVQVGLLGADELARIGQAIDQMARTIEADSLHLKETNLMLQYQALHDQLTDLPNRALLQDRLQQAIQSSLRNDQPLALLVMDLDRFKDVNDTLGHFTGDLLLQQVAVRLQSVLRKSDTVSRFGGDEFAILLPGANRELAAQIAIKVLNVLEVPFTPQGQALDIRASIGIAQFPEHGADYTTLMRHADVAMYAAKHNHSGFNFYNTLQDQYNLEQLTLTSELSYAIEHDHLILYYQPKVDIKTRKLTGVEALLRWQHHANGLIQPDRFIPMAERTGLIKPLTQWVLNEALRQLSLWRDAGLSTSMAINLSARNLPEPDLATQVSALLTRYNISPAWLELELTESAIMADVESAQALLTRLHDIGIHFSIDDFGTGYSSLSRLNKLPVGTIKIDKSFVINMTKNSDDAVIVCSTIDLAHNLGLKVIAEGVETQETWDHLALHGCDYAQGTFISPPLPADEFVRWLQESHWLQQPDTVQRSFIKS